VEAASVSMQLECRQYNLVSVDVFEKLEGSLVRVEPDFLELLFVDRNLASSTSFKRVSEPEDRF
tara:strand:+ start:1176 stop:1367 length:192 start_codon:yes stop_codon:yes gene_type:complete